MTCYRPVLCGYSKIDRCIRYGRPYMCDGLPLKDGDDFVCNIPIDCGKCIGCMLKYRSGWIVRLMSQLYTNIYKHGNGKASFVTLTYDDEHLPFNASLCYKDVQLFMKSVRHYYDKYFGVKDIKFLCAGEYGVNNNYSVYGDSVHGRPHYHLIILGCDFKEYFNLMQLHNNKPIASLLSYVRDNVKEASILPYRDKYMINTHGTTALRSPLVERLWKRGICVIGDVTASSCGYVAGYNIKSKMCIFSSLAQKEEHYKRNGEKIQVPFIETSRGFGLEFFNDYYKSIFTSKVVRLPNCEHSYPIPRIYNKWCEKFYPEYYKQVQQDRNEYFKNKEMDTIERLQVKEQLKEISASRLVRPLDDIGSLELVYNELPVVISQASSGV